MELKFTIQYIFLTNRITPIAPLWNWNLLMLQKSWQLALLQSHLYGIEIAYLWLMLSTLSLLQSHLYGIEMHYALWISVTVGKLQSHLYGIEIVKMKTNLRRYYGLQSHLYGIEMYPHKFLLFRLVQLQSHLYGIEIYSSIFQCLNSSLLQSHLYGIEIFFYCFNYLCKYITPIAPLWNWNTSKMLEESEKTCTPIAPLWNWNTTTILIVVFILQNSNRTFMELKSHKYYKKWVYYFQLQSHLYGIEIKCHLSNQWIY